VVSFKNAIIILTSNLGSAEIFNAAYATHKAGKGAAATGTATPADGGLLAREALRARGRLAAPAARSSQVHCCLARRSSSHTHFSHTHTRVHHTIAQTCVSWSWRVCASTSNPSSSTALTSSSASSPSGVC
jgi:hypothetical protein